MEDFWLRLVGFVFEQTPLDLEKPLWMLVFVAACGIMGSIAIAMDLLLFVARGTSLMSFAHSLRKTPMIAVAWVAGAVLGGYLGQILNILQATVLASLTAGVGWPLILARALERAAKDTQARPEVVQR